MAKAKTSSTPEVTIQLVNDWYGPDGKFRRVSDNPHTVVGEAAAQIPSSALVQDEDGKFKKQPRIAPKVIEDEAVNDEDYLPEDKALALRGMTPKDADKAEAKADDDKKAAAALAAKPL